jgi:hypothetical protein
MNALGDGNVATWGLMSNSEAGVSLPTEKGSSRPSSRQVSATHHPTIADHMGQIAERDDMEPDVSMYLPRPTSKAKAGAKKATIVELSDDDSSASEPEEATYEELTEIPYMITIMKAYYPDTCSPTDWQGNVDKWSIKLGALAPTQVGSALAPRPIFAIRTADKATSAAPTIVLDETAWLNLVREANEREKKIFLVENSKRNLRSKPKSMLPFYVSEVGNPHEQVNHIFPHYHSTNFVYSPPRKVAKAKDLEEVGPGPRAPDPGIPPQLYLVAFRMQDTFAQFFKVMIRPLTSLIKVNAMTSQCGTGVST